MDKERMELIKKFFPDPEREREFLEWLSLKTEEEKDAFHEQKCADFEKKSEEEKEAYEKAEAELLETIKERMDYIAAEIEEMKLVKKLGNVPDMVSLSYIAKHYFKKSSAWLYQRLNGNKVNGKPATLTSDEKKILATALNDMADKMKETSLSLC
jgi:hypothetical protein